MNEATTTTATTTQQAPQVMPEDLGGTVEERADAIFGPDVIDDGSDEGDEASAAAATETPADPPPAVEKTPEELAAERKARRDQTRAELQAKTRERVDAKSANREAEQLRQQLAQERAERARLVDPSQLNPLQIIELGQRAGHPPKAIVEALQSALGNPELAAAHAARTAVDPELAALKQDNAEMKQMLQGFLQQQQVAQQSAEDAAAYHGFTTFTAENAGTSPYAASFLKAYGPDEYRKIVEHVASRGAVGQQAILDDIEDLLIERHKQLATWNPTAAAAPERTQANPPRSLGTATQAPTHVTNTLAQQRSSVVDEDAALEDMPYEERASYLFRRR